MKIREYSTYDEYLAHQTAKTAEVKKGTCSELGSKWDRTRIFLGIFYRDRQYVPVNVKTLCLCARRGEEVEAFKLMGLDAIGIDLIAFPPLVQKADVHDLPFDDESFGFIFSNSFDHFLKPEVAASEISRVLEPEGRVMFHLSLGVWSEEMSLGLDSNIDVIELFPNMRAIADHKIPQYGGGINHLLVLQKK